MNCNVLVTSQTVIYQSIRIFPVWLSPRNPISYLCYIIPIAKDVKLKYKNDCVNNYQPRNETMCTNEALKGLYSNRNAKFVCIVGTVRSNFEAFQC